MTGKVAASLAAKGAAFAAAGAENHHFVLGPGPDLEKTWVDAGLALPDIGAMRRYRVDRVMAQCEAFGYDGVLVTDPMNVRYVTGTTNMQLWTMHNFARYAFIGADGYIVMFDYNDCEFLSGHDDLIDEVRYAATPLYFVSGTKWKVRTQRFVDHVLDLIRERVGSTTARIAVDQLPYHCYKGLEAGGVTIEHGQELMELARMIKSPDEIAAMRCAVHACEAAIIDMAEAMQPGMTERELWAVLHASNIARAGEWIETQIIASGSRTVPWMQEASSKVLERGEIVGFDTDMVGAYGMMCDISRTWIVGHDAPSADQQQVMDLAEEQMLRNEQLLVAGASFEEVCHAAWTPPVDDYFHYSVLYHGVGQCDEYPVIPFAHDWEATGSEGQLEPGMVLTTEAYVGARTGGEGVKLEDQYLITESGPEMLSQLPRGFNPYD